MIDKINNVKLREQVIQNNFLYMDELFDATTFNSLN